MANLQKIVGWLFLCLLHYGSTSAILKYFAADDAPIHRRWIGVILMTTD